MPTYGNETTWERYQREHEEYLAMLAKFSPKDIFALQHQLHNALALLGESVALIKDARAALLDGQIEDAVGVLCSDICTELVDRVEKEL